jgi:hypothetical protein
MVVEMVLMVSETKKKSKKTETEDSPAYVKKLLPIHWAREEHLDEALFLPYNQNEVTREEFDDIKKKISNKW